MNEPIILDLGTMWFVLDVTDGLRALRWTNRLTGRTLDLGHGPEVAFDIGLPDQPLVTPKLRVTGLPAADRAAAGEAVFTLEADEPPARVTVTYRWNASEPVLRKFVTIENRGGATWNRLLNMRLGDYATGATKLTGGELQVAPSFRDRAHRIGGLQGFPVYAGDEFFFSLAHPAGWATQEGGKISLRHYPGAVLKPGESRECMEAVYGVGEAEQARAAFVAHIHGRMRRVVRGHDRPYAIFEPFGGRNDGSVEERNRSADAAYAAGNLFDENEPYLLDMIAKVAEGQRGGAGRFDFTSFEFWVDHKGDIKRADPWRFPNQFERINTALREAGIAPGLWIDSSFCGWSIGGNPATRPAIVQEVAPEFHDGDAWKQWETQAYFCRATEPVRSMYTEGFLHHIRENGVRLLKFDNFNSQCSNPAHDHLPGVYGNEATHEAVIESYRAFDAACPDVFIMLYWGYRSPWWLLYGDTLFETGVEMEAASPGHMPALYVRDGVIRKLDQGHLFARDVPWLGTDSLGVWLSHWGGWNSGIGPERWQEGFVMDICRGPALAQLWTDPGWLTPPERRQVHEFIAMMKAQPACFTNARLLLGDPWKAEPYGYSCSDGHRAFLAINNGTWEDRVVTLDLGPAWGLECDGALDVYRWYPDPARLVGGPDGYCGTAQMAMRPFEVVLLEVVPHGASPSLSRTFRDEPMPTGFTEASCPVPVQVVEPEAAGKPWTLNGTIPASATGSILAVVLELADESGQPLELGNFGSFFAVEATVAGVPAAAQPALGPEGYPSSWQTWRIAVPPAAPPQSFAVRIADLPGKSSWMNAGNGVSTSLSYIFLRPMATPPRPIPAWSEGCPDHQWDRTRAALQRYDSVTRAKWIPRCGKRHPPRPAPILDLPSTAVNTEKTIMTTLQQNRCGDWTFTSQGKHDDPFNQIELTVCFTHAATGAEKRVPAFWAGGREWRVRFAAHEVGTYRFRTKCSDPSDCGLHGQEGELKVVPYKGANPLLRHGPVRVAADGRHFAHADGTPFFWLGDTWWMGLCQRLDWPRGFRALAADRVKKGFTVVQIVAGLYPDMPAFDPRGANEAGFPWTEDYGRINPAYFDAADRRIEHLVNAGLMPCIVGCWGYFLPWLGVDKMKKHWHYLVARYGALPVTWCLAGEGTMPYYLTKTWDADVQTQKKGWTELAAHLHAIDSFVHPVTIHPSSSARQCVEEPALLDYDMLQTGHGDRASLPNTVKQVRVSRRAEPRMPVVEGEVCYEGIGAYCGPELQRWLFWACLLNGAAGFTYAANGIWQVNTRKQPYGPSPHGMTWGNTPWEDACRLPGSTCVGVGKRILERLPWWQLEPHPEWTDPNWPDSLNDEPFTCGKHDVPLAAGIPGKLHVIYCPMGAGLRLVKGLKPGVQYRLTLVDPLTGAEVAGGEVMPDADGNWVPVCPGTPAWFPRPIYQDWLLILATSSRGAANMGSTSPASAISGSMIPPR